MDLRKTVNQIIEKNLNSTHSDYRCPICDTYIPPREIEIPSLGIKSMVQPVCECESEQDKKFFEKTKERKEKHEIKKLFSLNDLGKRFEESEFDNLIPRPGTESAIKTAQQYIREFESWGCKSLLIWGRPGNGKTHIASAIAKTLDEQGYSIVFQSVPELLERIRSTFRKNSRDTEEQIMKALLNCDLLILDDIGAEKLTDWVQDIIFRIVDGRYRKEKPILYTSNLTMEGLAEQVSYRTYDRITETSVLVQNKSSSYRLEVAKKRFEKLSDN